MGDYENEMTEELCLILVRSTERLPRQETMTTAFPETKSLLSKLKRAVRRLLNRH